MALAQQAYRFGVDELAENTHGWLAAQNTPISRARTNTGTFLLRLLLQNNASAANNQTITWQYSKNGAAYTGITTTSSNVKAVAATPWADQDSPTSRLTGGSGTFESSSSTLTEDGVTGGNNCDVVASGYCETGIALQLVTADLAQGDTLQFRVTATTAITAYNATPLLVVTGSDAYTANPVNCDGTNDYLTRGAALTGQADSALWAASWWFRRTGNNGVLARFFIDNNASARSSIHMLANNEAGLVGRNAVPANVLELETLTTITDTAWHHVMASRNGSARHLYLDGVNALDNRIDTGAAIDFDAATNYGVGGSAAGANKFTGDLADLWIAFGQYIDLSNSSNRQLFLSAGGAPADLGAFGETPTGTSPTCYFTGPTGSWHVNRGSGGGFTVNGALTDGTGAVQLPGGAQLPGLLLLGVGC